MNLDITIEELKAKLEKTNWGKVGLEVTVKNGKITNIQVIHSESYSIHNKN